MKYYILSISGYEFYTPYILQGPETKYWNEFCKGLIKNLLTKNCAARVNDSVMNMLLIELEKFGYKRITLPEAKFYEGDLLKEI